MAVGTICRTDGFRSKGAGATGPKTKYWKDRESLERQVQAEAEWASGRAGLEAPFFYGHKTPADSRREDETVALEREKTDNEPPEPGFLPRPSRAWEEAC